ncbi:MAG: T9SS type A sorting domain-containing protein [Bacteroidales bacterium]|nr:T9SS type A sorting domain-containing protein [Bacteroidales bacterium]
MMKKLLSFSLCLMLVATMMGQSNNEAHLKAREGNRTKNIAFPASDIQFWCGTGSNEAVIVVGWDDSTPAVAYAWGVRWEGDVVAIDLVDSIAAYDSRFSYQFGGGLISNVEYADGNMTLASVINYWCYYINGDWADGYGSQVVVDGDYLELSASCTWTLTTAIAATNPNGGGEETPADATIAASDIVYWVGAGSNEVVMAVNWADPDTALAWGFRFGADSVTLEDMMDAIQADDPRFSYVRGWGVSDIRFALDDDTLALSQPESGNYWWYNLNGTASSFSFDQLYLSNGDFVKWGDPRSGVVVDTMWGYPSEIVWLTEIHAVSEPSPVVVEGPFCGAVGTEGCTAVKYDDSRILGWATTCQVERGYTDVANPGSYVSFGDSSMAVGPCDNNNVNVVSLGDGGRATLTFEYPIANGEGYDFAVYENSFNDSFLELAFVEVSSDGEHFVRFPATSLTPTTAQVGPYGSVDPTFINNLAGKYRAGWGTPFDLDELRDSANLDVNNIRYVRVVDVVGSVDPQYGSKDAFGHLVNDPYPTDGYSGGFDLDGVAVMHFAEVGVDDVLVGEAVVYPNPASTSVVCQVKGEGSHRLCLYDMTGRILMQRTFSGTSLQINLSDMANGVYMIRVDGFAKRLAVRR